MIRNSVYDVRFNSARRSSSDANLAVAGFVLLLIAALILIPVSIHLGSEKARETALKNGFSTVESTSIKLISFCPKGMTGFSVEGTDAKGTPRTADACVYSIDLFNNSFVKN